VPPRSSSSTCIGSRLGVLLPGDLRSAERRGQETLAERKAPNGGVRRPSPNEKLRTAGSGDPRRTKTSGQPNGGVRRPSPNEELLALGPVSGRRLLKRPASATAGVVARKRRNLYFSILDACSVPVNRWSCTGSFWPRSLHSPSSDTAVPDRRRITCRPSVSRTAGSGDPRRTTNCGQSVRREVSSRSQKSARTKPIRSGANRWQIPA